MQHTFPLQEEHINRYSGVPVCIITHDGNQHFGILHGCENDHVILNRRTEQQYISSVDQQDIPQHNKIKTKKRNLKGSKTKQIGKAHTQAYYGGYGGYGYGYGAEAAIGLASIALLFLLI